MKINKTKYFIKAIIDPATRFRSLAARGFYNYLSDEKYICKMFRARMGYRLDLKKCTTFNEKLQLIKLYDHKPLYSTIVDKYEVKEYVGGIIGKGYIVPTYGVWESIDDIDFEGLPDKFVLKCTHDSGGICVVKEKNAENIRVAKRIIERSLKKNYFYLYREWPYKNVKPRIIAEQYLESNSYGGITDYKIHCFSGEPKYILVCKDRYTSSGLTEDFFDIHWNHIDVRRPKHCNSLTVIPKPDELDELLNLARRLSNGFPFIRVDFYIIEHKVYFGELTFFPNGGFEKFIPESFDYLMGSLIQL